MPVTRIYLGFQELLSVERSFPKGVVIFLTALPEATSNSGLRTGRFGRVVLEGLCVLGEGAVHGMTGESLGEKGLPPQEAMPGSNQLGGPWTPEGWGRLSFGRELALNYVFV